MTVLIMNVALVSLIFFVIPMCQPFPFITRSLRSIMFPLHSVILLLSLSNDHDLIICVKWSRSAPLHLIYSYIYIYVHLFPSNYLCSWLLLSTVVSYGKGSMWCGCVLTGFLVPQVFSFFHFFSSCFCFRCLNSPLTND